MFGMRSLMQVKHKVPLYNWKRDWHNSGSQVVHDYEAKGNVLIGDTERFSDEVKITKQGELISRLSLRDDKSVVAYSVCKTR